MPFFSSYLTPSLLTTPVKGDCGRNVRYSCVYFDNTKAYNCVPEQSTAWAKDFRPDPIRLRPGPFLLSRFLARPSLLQSQEQPINTFFCDCFHRHICTMYIIYRPIPHMYCTGRKFSDRPSSLNFWPRPACFETHFWRPGPCNTLLQNKTVKVCNPAKIKKWAVGDMFPVT